MKVATKRSEKDCQNGSIPKMLPSQKKSLYKMDQLYFDRSQIFHQNNDLGWRLLDSECSIHVKADISVLDITELSSIYVRIIQTLNSMQDERQKYFSYKMQKLMQQPYIIRCLNNQFEQKKGKMDHKRKQLEQRLMEETQKHHHTNVFNYVLVVQDQKQKKMKQKISQIQTQQEQTLNQRIRKRLEIKQMRSSIMSPIKAFSSADNQEERGNFSESTRRKSGMKHAFTNQFQFQEFDLDINQKDHKNITNLKREVELEDEMQRVWRKNMRQNKQKDPLKR